MRQPSRNVSNSSIDHRQMESGLFQLPSLPPWGTPGINQEHKQPKNHFGNHNSYRNHYTTPLRKSSSLLLYHSQQTQQQIHDDQIGSLADLSCVKLNNTECKEKDTEYDFTQFSNKSLLKQSKINDYLNSERAVHCLVFHKEMHLNDADEYRPDLSINCGEFNTATIFKDDDNDSILLHVPGCTKQDMNILFKKDYMSQRPNIRRIDEILNHETNALNRFWDNSELPKTLDRNHLHEQYLILQQEQKELDKVKANLRPDTSNNLKEYSLK